MGHSSSRSQTFTKRTLSHARMSWVPLYHFRISLWVILVLQVGDNGIMYRGVCQRREICALRVRGVGSRLRMHDETDMVESSIPGFDRWNLKHNKSSSNSPCHDPLL